MPTPGPQNGRYAAEPLGGLTSLKAHEKSRAPLNASAALAVAQADTIKRIDGSEVPILTPWIKGAKPVKKQAKKAVSKPTAKKASSEKTAAEKKPRTLSAPRKSGADDLKLISGVGPKLEGVLNELGFWHFDQIAKWTSAEIAWVDTRLKFKGRIERDDWIPQAEKMSGEKNK